MHTALRLIPPPILERSTEESAAYHKAIAERGQAQAEQDMERAAQEEEIERGVANV